MSQFIPLITSTSITEQSAWLSALNEAAKNIDEAQHEQIIKIVPFTELNEAQVSETEVAIVANPNPEALRQLPNLKWVQSLWAGVEHMVKNLDQSVSIARMTDPQLAATMAEAALAWTLYLHRDMPLYRKQQTERHWQGYDAPLPEQQTIGILGLGLLGEKAALKLKQNQFNVLGWSRSKKKLPEFNCLYGDDGLQEILKRSNILIILLPLTDETAGLINEERLQLMPKGASLINFARGPIVDDTALSEALECGHLKHAVLDVFEVEPLPVESPLWSHPSITILPHISAPTNKTTASKVAVNNVRTYLKTGTLPPVVDRTKGY